MVVSQMKMRKRTWAEKNMFESKVQSGHRGGEGGFTRKKRKVEEKMGFKDALLPLPTLEGII